MEFLEKLTQLSGPSGAEDEVREAIKAEAIGKCDDMHIDPLGNLIVLKKGTAAEKKKIMVAAHMDEIGIIIKGIDKNGFMRFDAIGGLDIRYLPGRRVQFLNGVCGVIGCEEEEFRKKPAIEKLFVDTGTAEKANESVKTGDMAVFCGDFREENGIITSKALDNRAGCYILLKTLEKLTPKNDILMVFTVQEEVGLRGAGAAAFALAPDYALAVDVTDTGDTPKAPVMEVKLGKGAAVKIMDSSVLCDAGLRNMIMDTAKSRKIPYQAEIMTDGGTDAGRIHLTRGGVRTGGISLPVRYIHSPSEMASAADINACIELLAAVLNEL